jgi:hypothetical protein
MHLATSGHVSRFPRRHHPCCHASQSAWSGSGFGHCLHQRPIGSCGQRVDQLRREGRGGTVAGAQCVLVLSGDDQEGSDPRIAEQFVERAHHNWPILDGAHLLLFATCAADSGSVTDWLPGVLGVVGALTGVGGVLVSVLARRDAAASARAAEEARAGADSLEVSVQRIADTLADQNERQHQRGEAMRHLEPGFTVTSGRKRPIDVNDLPTDGPLPAFNLEFVRGHAYRLRNTGAIAATGVSVSPEGLPVVANRLPRDVVIEPFRSTETFILQGAMGAPLPGEIAVTCNELSNPVVIPIPAPSR